MQPDELYAFLRDPNLLELIEQNKTTDDLFEVIKLNENQHSDVLAWCMNPNEGHSQGDAVIKDFLEAAYVAATDSTGDNKKFFAKWTSGRIRTSSFGAAFVTREFSVNVDEGTKKGRLDLFLVDPQNKLMVTIENKAGTNLTALQLNRYAKAVKAEVSSRRVFSDYDQALVVLDRDLSDYSEADLGKLGKRWAFLDYTWLEASANRARFQIARDKNAAQLLVAYCQKQTEWESPTEKRISELSADLALAHASVIDAIRSIQKQPVLEWIPKTLIGASGELTIFRAQHPEVCKQLVSIQGIATIIQQLLKIVPSLHQDQIETGRTWFNAMPISALSLVRDTDDAYWPLFVNLYRNSKASRPDAPKFNLRLVWARNQFNFSTCNEADLRAHIAEAYPELKKFQASDYRNLMIAKSLSPADAIKETKELFEKINNKIRTYNNKA